MTQIVKICDLSIAHPESWCLTTYLDENLSDYNVQPYQKRLLEFETITFSGRTIGKRKSNN